MTDNQEEVYKQFDIFDWGSLKEFQDGLSEILEAHLEKLKESDPSIDRIPAPQRQQLVDQAKSFFFCSHTGNILNLDDYYAWKREQRSKKIEEIEEPAPQAESSSPAPYSNNYQQIVDMIVSGKPVPGIKQIPETVLTEKSSKATAPVRSKPWETKTDGH